MATLTQTLRPAQNCKAHEKPDFLSEYHEEDHNIQSQLVRHHPLGVRPSGNALTSDQDLSLSMGSLGRIPDSLLLVLFEWLDQDALLQLAQTCRGLFAFSMYDQLWREFALSQSVNDVKWRGSWRASLLGKHSKLPKIDCRHLFSDALYRPFQCTHMSLSIFAASIPKRNLISKLINLSNDQFISEWSNRPFILTEPVKTWQVYHSWNEKSLLEKYAAVRFRAEAVDWTLENYISYMNDNSDESPLYLFDRSFVTKMGLTVGEGGAYVPPDCFQEDLFTLLGDLRPDHRWLIIGPERSGSTFHKDPNATSAWNAVIRGSKYWIMFPNSVMPPGVYVSEDQSEVTSPLSIAEWLLTFHQEARQTMGCIEGICGPGEILHVPSGWWHLVVNLEPSIAITQNFVPRSHLSAAINFLKNKPDQVSGFSSTVQNPYAVFMERLKAERPDLYSSVQERSDRKRKWANIVDTSDTDGAERGGFCFGFGEDDLEAE